MSAKKDTIGWDIGGAHLKVVALDSEGRLSHALQLPCTLWRGIEHLEGAISQALREVRRPGARHAVTMTGELADCFANRSEGVAQIVHVITSLLPAAYLYAKGLGFLRVEQALKSPLEIASANWHATAEYIARQVSEALLLDIGSTTTDITLIAGGRVCALGADDHTRLTHDELLYTGVVRTPLMAVAHRIPFGSKRVNLMAEHFANAADVYRLTGELPQDADQLKTADGAGKNIADSARRLARMVGCDFEDASLESWRELAGSFASEQVDRIIAACETSLSRGLLGESAPIVAAGVGVFLARKIAARLNRPCRDFASFVETTAAKHHWTSQCAPAFAVAWLLKDSGQTL